MITRIGLATLCIVLLSSSLIAAPLAGVSPIIELYGVPESHVRVEALNQAGNDRDVTGVSPAMKSTEETMNYVVVTTWTAPHDGIRSAVFSDDGVDVEIASPHGPFREALKRHGQGQALPKLSQSYRRLDRYLDGEPIVFEKGKTYTFKITYSNTLWTGRFDVDGLSLFLFDGPKKDSVRATVPRRVPLGEKLFIEAFISPANPENPQDLSGEKVTFYLDGQVITASSAPVALAPAQSAEATTDKDGRARIVAIAKKVGEGEISAKWKDVDSLTPDITVFGPQFQRRDYSEEKPEWIDASVKPYVGVIGLEESYRMVGRVGGQDISFINEPTVWKYPTNPASRYTVSTTDKRNRTAKFRSFTNEPPRKPRLVGYWWQAVAKPTAITCEVSLAPTHRYKELRYVISGQAQLSIQTVTAKVETKEGPTPAVDDNYNAPDGRDGTYMHFGEGFDLEGDKPGILVTIKETTIPKNVSGKFVFFQVGETVRTLSFTQGGKAFTYVLDTEGVDGTTPFSDSDNSKLWDSPAVRVEPSHIVFDPAADGSLPAPLAGSIHDQFTTYVMFLPDVKNGQPRIYVPLYRLDWSWKFQAIKRGGKWRQVRNPTVSIGGVKPAGDFPTWNNFLAAKDYVKK